MNSVIYYRGPIGEYSGDWEYVTRGKTSSALFWKEGWERWLSYDEAEAKLIEEGCIKKGRYRWYPATSKKFSYIGPRLAMEHVGVGTVLAEIAKDPNARHVVHHVSWMDWREWTMISEIYEAVKSNYPNLSLPPAQKQPKNRPIVKLGVPRHFGQIWEDDPASTVLKRGGISGVRSDILHRELQEKTPSWAAVSIQHFDAFKRREMAVIKQYIRKKLSEEGSFCWPGLGTFWLENRENQQMYHSGWQRSFRNSLRSRLRFKAAQQLRDALHNRRALDGKHPFGGEERSFRNLHYWANTSDPSTLSRRRRFVYDLCSESKGQKSVMMDQIQIITAVICANLVAKGSCRVSCFGEFSVRDRHDGRAVFFKELYPEKINSFAVGLAGNSPRGAGSLWFWDTFRRYHDLSFSKAGKMSDKAAQKLADCISSVENPFLVAQITFYVLQLLPKEGKHLSTKGRSVIEKVHQDYAVTPSDQALPKKEDRVSGKKVVFTGKWTSGTRKEVVKAAEDLGADSVSAVSSLIDYVVAGDKPGSTKINAAKKHNIPIIDEKTWLTYIAEAKAIQAKKKKKS